MLHGSVYDLKVIRTHALFFSLTLGRVGVASIEVGAIKGTAIDWETTGIIRSPSAKVKILSLSSASVINDTRSI